MQCELMWRRDYLPWPLECKDVVRRWVEFFFVPDSRCFYLAVSQMQRLEQETGCPVRLASERASWLT